MRATDDCKPVDDNKKILISSSGGGVVLFKNSLYSGHGVVCMPETEQFFALGDMI